MDFYDSAWYRDDTSSPALPSIGVPSPESADSGLIDIILNAGKVLDEQAVFVKERRLYIVPPHIADLVKNTSSEENQ